MPGETKQATGEGVQVRGTFAGLTEGDFPKLVVSWMLPNREAPVTREIEYRAFHPQHGETPIKKMLDGLAIGDRVAVGVFVNEKAFIYRTDGAFGDKTWKAGDAGSMVTYRAIWVEALA
jgi:hypothetical protein